jgi:hypothetical protein
MKYFYTLFFCIFLVFYGNKVDGQSPNIPTNYYSYQAIKDIEIEAGRFSDCFHSNLNQINAQTLLAFSKDSVYTASLQSAHLINALIHSAEIYSPKVILDRPRKRLYQQKSYVYHFKNEDFVFAINPVVLFEFGKDFSNQKNISYNTRGIEIQGSMFGKIGYYTFVSDNIVYPILSTERYSRLNLAYPTASLSKNIGNGGYNFMQARGYVNYSPVKQIQFQFGHDRLFTGDGYRSMIISDFGKEFLYGKAAVNTKRIAYQIIGGQMINRVLSTDSNTYQKKYFAYHHLSINITPKLNIGLFESMIFRRTSGFDFSYASPFIFYRSVEHGLNSSDNALLGINYRWIPWKKILIYGQVVLDEFRIGQAFSSNGWYGNKYAMQTGIKCVNPFSLKGFSVLAEFNFVRPYTFQHFDKSQNYTHYNTPIAHPLGANFKELVIYAKYEINARNNFQLLYTTHLKGYDLNQINYGGDIIFADYNNPVSFYNNTIGQGLGAKVHLVQAMYSLTLFPKWCFDVVVLFRESKSVSALYNYHIFSPSVRMRYNLFSSDILL